MSSEQPPKEYIIDADTLATFGDYFLSAVNGDEDKTKLIQLWKSNLSVATSRPHSSPTLLEIAKQYENIPPTSQQIKIEAARKAREDVLQEGIALVQKRIDGIFEAYRGEEAVNITARPFAAADGMGEAINMLKSLRSTTPQTEQEQPR